MTSLVPKGSARDCHMTKGRKRASTHAIIMATPARKVRTGAETAIGPACARVNATVSLLWNVNFLLPRQNKIKGQDYLGEMLARCHERGRSSSRLRGKTCAILDDEFKFRGLKQNSVFERMQVELDMRVCNKGGGLQSRISNKQNTRKSKCQASFHQGGGLTTGVRLSN